MKKIVNRIVLIITLFVSAILPVSLATGFPVNRPFTAPPPAPAQILPPWHIEANPTTLYLRPPQCDASFTITVTVDEVYRTATARPIKIYIERSTVTVGGHEASIPSGLWSEPSYEQMWEGMVPNWQATVTLIGESPWEVPAGDYPLKIWAYPADLSQAEGMAYNVFVVVHLIYEDTGVETCNQPPPPPPPPSTKCTEDTVETLQYCPDSATWKMRRTCQDGQWVTETQNCPTRPPGDWWDWWQWWRWNWWVSWWPWTTQEFDFYLAATPASQYMKAGESASFTTDVRLVSGIAQPVTLSLSGLPGGMSYSFSVPSANPRFTSTLQISSQSSVSPGTYPVTIVGTGGGKTHSVSVSLVVAENKQSSSLSLSASSSSLKVGESVALGGALSPGLATTVELVYTRPDGFELVKHVTTSSAGAFSDTINPDLPGSWSVKARWPGDADHYASESQIQSFTVEPLPEQPPSFWDQIVRILPTVIIAAIILALVFLTAVLVRRRSTRKMKGSTTISVRLCSKCRTTIPEGSEYCPNCGEKL